MTTEQKARFFGQHIGCKYQYINPDFPQMTPAIFTNCGLITDDGNYRVRNENGFNKQAFRDCKLILRPLSSITDEEAIECARIAYGWNIKKSTHQIERHSGLLYVWVGHNKFEINWQGIEEEVITCLFLDGKEVGHNALWVCEYLRSLNFALPFQGIDPIKAGWAVLES
jgi:hypothetical protein